MKKDKTFDAQAYMKLAIEEMRRSRPERRDDGKVSPKVGAVLVKADGSVERAHRGELRDGDHAEFTLLERKNRSTDLEGSVLFATLEPCAPGARNEPKRACAERIVLARIKTVYVGIEDPDPKVDRKGIKYLQDNGVEVVMFAPRFQEEIREANKDFITQAKERAEFASNGKTKEIELSTLEQPASGQIENFSEQALEELRSAIKSDAPINSAAFNQRLVQLGLVVKSGGHFLPTGFGNILFGNESRFTTPQARLLATLHNEDGEEVETFDGPQVLVPDIAIQWLRSKLPNLIDRTEAHRRESNTKFYELVREGIVNALAHRDYDQTGAKCLLDVWRDRVEIRSPGAPVSPITLAQMQSFQAPTLSRNPVMTNVFSLLGLMEERGLGLKSMRESAQRDGLPSPRYDFYDPYLVLTIYRTADAVSTALPADIRNSLNEDELTGLEFVLARGAVSRRDYSSFTGFDDRKAQRHLRHFVQLGLLKTEGATTNIRYIVTNRQAPG